MLDNIKEKYDIIKSLKERFLRESEDVNFKDFGYAADIRENKTKLLNILEEANFARDDLLGDMDLFPNGLSKIPYELDWSSSVDEVTTAFDALLSDIKESDKKLAHVNEPGEYLWVRYRLAEPEIMKVVEKDNYVDIELVTFDGCKYEIDAPDITVLEKVKKLN